MVERLSEERLEAVLISVGAHLVLPPATEVAVVEAHPPWRDRRSWQVLAAAAVVVAIVAATLLVPPARTAVARWLGIGSTEIQILPAGETEGTDLPSVVDGLTPISAPDAATILNGPLPDTSATRLGAPDNIYTMPEGGVLLAWSDEAATLWVQTDRLEGGVLLQKLIGADQEVEEIDGLGDAGLFIAGDHTLQTPHRRLAADSVVLWIDDGVEYRFEADLNQDAMIAFALAVN